MPWGIGVSNLGVMEYSKLEYWNTGVVLNGWRAMTSDL
jgi:hypothetical protein